MLVGKRRRMRTVSAGQKDIPVGAVASTTAKPDKKKTKGKKGKQQEGSCNPNVPANTAIPIFLKKTYKMIDTCDPAIAGWTEDGEMFVVKDPDLFATEIIPQYFDHNKFSSFARQLNFYGFRKMQAKPIRNADFDSNTAKYVTFYNEKFKRGRCDLLKEIQRSTRGGNSGNATAAEQQKEIDSLKAQVVQLENQVDSLNSHFEERLRTVELNMLGQMERMMIALGHQPNDASANGMDGFDGQQQAQQQQQPPLPQQQQPSMPDASSVSSGQGLLPGIQRELSWNPVPFLTEQQQQQNQAAGQPPMQNQNPMMQSQFPGMPQGSGRSPSVDSNMSGGSGGPTLPPHPKQKNLGPLPENMTTNDASNMPMNQRFPSIGIGRGLSVGMPRGLSTDSSASAVMMKNSWEDKFFHALMLGDNDAAVAAQQQMAAGNGGGSVGGVGTNFASGPVSDEAMQQAIQAAQMAQQGQDARQTTVSTALEAPGIDDL